MIALILAGGNGDRFRASGYPMIKPMLPMSDGRPLIAWVDDQLPAQCERIAVVQARDAGDLGPWLVGARLVELHAPTSGPLESAHAARGYLASELLIVYCDVLLDCAAFVDAARGSGAPHACVTFASDDPRFGYWMGDRVVEGATESGVAVSGVFWFRDAAAFVERVAAAPAGAGVVALLDAATYCHAADPIDLGTPREYEEFMDRVHVGCM